MYRNKSTLSLCPSLSLSHAPPITLMITLCKRCWVGATVFSVWIRRKSWLPRDEQFFFCFFFVCCSVGLRWAAQRLLNICQKSVSRDSFPGLRSILNKSRDIYHHLKALFRRRIDCGSRDWNMIGYKFRLLGLIWKIMIKALKDEEIYQHFISLCWISDWAL